MNSCQTFEIPAIEVSRARRRCRRPFFPSVHVGGRYRLPLAVMELLGHRLQGRRNAEAVYRLGVYLARNHVASRLAEAFTVSRRGFDETGGLVGVADLGLTERQVRSGLAVLEEVGFLVRSVPAGNGWQGTSAGVRKAPIRFRFGPEFFPLFLAAKAARRRPDASRTKCPGRSPFGARIDLGQIEKPEVSPVAVVPLAPKGFSMKAKGPAWAPNPERVAALARLAELQARPLVLASPAILRTMFEGRK